MVHATNPRTYPRRVVGPFHNKSRSFPGIHANKIDDWDWAWAYMVIFAICRLPPNPVFGFLDHSICDFSHRLRVIFQVFDLNQWDSTCFLSVLFFLFCIMNLTLELFLESQGEGRRDHGEEFLQVGASSRFVSFLSPSFDSINGGNSIRFWPIYLC